ncbi:MAG: Gfo/Idh/MocA family oxidoreductase [Planctomycetia bacterium]|nr:Gfo/Idh/MocA family oxidoreductase [Planctomycetia bacterium]
MSIHRRNFLKAGSMAAGAAALGMLSTPRMAHADGGDKLRAVLIGCGGRGRGAATNFLKVPNTEIVAAADAFENNAKSVMKMFNLTEDQCFWGFDAYRKVLAVDCDYVILATPPGFRPIHYKAAVEAGKHVFMEKPCCVDAPGFKMLMEVNKLVDEKGLKVGVGLQRHHQAGYLQGIKEIADGKLGDFVFSRVYWNGSGVWVRPRQEKWTEMEFQMRNWYYFNWLCGDNICEQHVHNLDVGNWAKTVMSGKNLFEEYCHPVKCNGMGGREVRKGNPNYGEIFDHHYVEFEYADGTRMISQCRHQPRTWNSASEHVHGTKKVGGENVSGRAKGRDPFEQEHFDLVDAIRNGTRYHEGYIGAYSSMTAVLGRMATYSGQVIHWDEAVEKGRADMIYENHDQLTMESTPPVKLLKNGQYSVAVPGQWKPW